MRKQSLESILKSSHIRISIPLELEAQRDNFDGPVSQRSALTGLEAQIEEARITGVGAKSVHGAFRIGFGVSREPLFCKLVEVSQKYLTHPGSTKRKHIPVCCREPI